MSEKLENENQKDNTATSKYIQSNIELKTIKKKEEQSEEAVVEYNRELEMLKTKCSHYESALERVLYFIVPDNCRGMVEQALAIGKSDFTKTSL
jgi:hypothetical protein